MTNKIKYRLVQGEGIATVTVFDPKGPKAILVANETHPNFHAIVQGAMAGDESVYGLFDVATGMMNRFRSITERVSYDGTNVLWDGDPVHNVIADQIQRALEQGEQNYEALAKFWEKLDSNPEDHSREQAYNWLATHDFKITADGDVVAYKGVVPTDEGFESSACSEVRGVPSAYVDGQPVPELSRVPQNVGSVVTMPRSEVKFDPRQHCARGLHVGDWSYAEHFSRGAVLEVHVNPRDIVSVPNDHGYRKVRVCRYVVHSVVTSERTGGPVVKPADVSATWQDVGTRV